MFREKEHRQLKSVHDQNKFEHIFLASSKRNPSSILARPIHHLPTVNILTHYIPEPDHTRDRGPPVLTPPSTCSTRNVANADAAIGGAVVDVGEVVGRKYGRVAVWMGTGL
jgi:poly(A) polymerase Pap1